MDVYYWLIIMSVLIILELMTMGLTTIWFAIGALFAFIVGLIGANLLVQIIVFVVISVVALLLTRPIAVKFFNGNREKTNVEGLIGKKAVVTEEIDNLGATGHVTINGMEWMAKASDENEIIKEGTTVVIEAVSGVKLIVNPAERPEE